MGPSALWLYGFSGLRSAVGCKPREAVLYPDSVAGDGFSVYLCLEPPFPTVADETQKLVKPWSTST